MAKSKKVKGNVNKSDYSILIGDISGVLEAARRTSARSVSAILTSAYWIIGRKIVEFEQKGSQRAEYGGKLI